MILELFALCVSLYILFKFFHPICGGGKIIRFLELIQVFQTVINV